MRVDEYRVMSECVEGAVVAGLQRIYKHEASPLPEYDAALIASRLPDIIMGMICEYFDFDAQNQEPCQPKSRDN